MALSKSMKGKLQVISVDLGEAPDVVRAFAHKNGVPFPILIGNDAAAAKYSIEGIPSNVVVAPNGIVTYAAEGYEEDEILAAVRKATPRPPAVKSRRHVTHSRRADASSAGATQGPFPDVPPDHWAAQAVETLRVKGIVIGYPPQ